MYLHRRGHGARVVAVLAGAALALAACGDANKNDANRNDAGAGPSVAAPLPTPAATGGAGSASGESAPAPKQADLRLGIIPIADVAPVFIGIEEGYFADEGLTVTTEFAQGGAAAIPALLSGDIDAAFGAYPSFFSAVQEGLPLLIATAANMAAPMFGGIYAMPDSGIATPADLAGTTISVNTLNNIVQIAVATQLAGAGLTLEDVTLVELPFPEMPAALERGDVHAIAVVEPFATAARNNLEAVLVADMFAGEIEGFPVAGFYVTTGFAETNPNTVAAFQRGWARAVEHANTVDDAVPQIMPTYIETATVEGARELHLPHYVSGLDTESIQQIPDFMVEQGLLDEPIDVADHIAGHDPEHDPDHDPD